MSYILNASLVSLLNLYEILEMTLIAMAFSNRVSRGSVLSSRWMREKLLVEIYRAE